MDDNLLHARSITVQAREIDPQRLVLVGHLHDTRPRAYRNMVGHTIEAGTVHDMRVELELSVPQLTILAARATMPGTPLPDCREVESRIDTLVGLKISTGFTRELKRRLGGPVGCAHLSALVQAMSAIALQGASMVLESRSAKQRAKVAHEHALNTCHLFREDGPIIQRMKAAIDIDSTDRTPA